MITPDQKALERSFNGLQVARLLYFKDPNVSYIDVGYRIKDTENYKLEDELTVRVHVKKKLRGEEFEAFKKLHPERVIDDMHVGFPTDVPQARFHLDFWNSYNSYFWFRPNSPINRHDPLCGGISISNKSRLGFGTLGGIVKSRLDGSKMVLSNWHVLAGSERILPGEPIYQPGLMHGGEDEDIIANYAQDAMKYNIDAAVAKLNSNRACSNYQKYIGAVTGVKTPELGMSIMKSGVRSYVTMGRIVGIKGIFKNEYYGPNTTIENVFSIKPLYEMDEVSAAGDSGSWWLENITRQAVGLHFAGSDYPEYALAISMTSVLDALRVDVILND
jgi:endonuclease G